MSEGADSFSEKIAIRRLHSIGHYTSMMLGTMSIPIPSSTVLSHFVF